MGNDVTIKFGADTSEHLAKVAKMNEAHEKTSGHLNKHIELGDKFTHGLERSLGHAIGLVAIFHKVTEAITESVNKAAELNKKFGGESQSLASSMMQFGYGGEQLEGAMASVNRLGGRATKEERAGAASTMAKAQREHEKLGLPAITDKQFSEVLQFGIRGGSLVYGQNMEELTGIFTDRDRGYGIDLDVSKYAQDIARRQGRLGPGVSDPLGTLLSNLPENIRNEGRQRSRDFRAELRKEEAGLGPIGLGARQAQRDKELFEIEHPVGAALINNPLSNAVYLGTRAAGYAEGERLQMEKERLELEKRNVLRSDSDHDEKRKP